MVAEVRERFGVSEAYRNLFSPPTQPAAEPLDPLEVLERI